MTAGPPADSGRRVSGNGIGVNRPAGREGLRGVAGMTDDEIVALVRATFPEDWFGEGASLRLKADHSLRIAPGPFPDGRGWPAFRAPWAAALGPSAELVTLDLWYGDRRVHRFDLVGVKGIPGYLPRPAPGTTLVPWNEYRLARVLTPAAVLARCLEAAGLTVGGGPPEAFRPAP